MNNWLKGILIFILIYLVLSTVFSLLFRFLPLILIVGVVYYAYKSYKQAKIQQEENEYQTNQSIYDNFFDRDLGESASFDKDDFFNGEQSEPLNIVDAQVVERKEEDDD